MFEYSKEILTKVSFDQKLFLKELGKALSWLKKEEKKLLLMWCLTTFGHKYGEVILQTFRLYLK
ncbi:MAG: hypothetical protein LW707_09460 [Sphingobacteriales bacterium]|jgi:hypothetical protein|nr:hypothetical protein [Sphingobacteriales bacterium]